MRVQSQRPTGKQQRSLEIAFVFIVSTHPQTLTVLSVKEVYEAAPSTIEPEHKRLGSTW